MKDHSSNVSNLHVFRANLERQVAHKHNPVHAKAPIVRPQTHVPAKTAPVTGRRSDLFTSGGSLWLLALAAAAAMVFSQKTEKTEKSWETWS
jgi:hypothetical protein